MGKPTRSAGEGARPLAISASLFVVSAAAFYSAILTEKRVVLGFTTLALPILFFLVGYFLLRWIGIGRVGDQTSAGLAVYSFPRRSRRMTPEQYAAYIRDTARGLASDDLLAAYHNPNNEPDVSRAVVDEVAARGLSGESVTDWMPPAERLFVSSALPAGRTPESYLTKVHIRAAFVDIASVFMTAVIIGFVIGLAWVIANRMFNLPAPLPGVQVASLALLLAALWTLFRHYWRSGSTGLIVVAYCLILFFLTLLDVRLPVLDYSPLLGLACLPLAPLVTRGRRARILLLRPFGRAPMSAALKRVVRRNLGVLGAVFTLSDRNYKPSVSMGVLRWLGGWFGLFGSVHHIAAPLVRPSLRIATVWNEFTYRGLARTMSHNLMLDFKSAYCGDQAFNIASSDAWWKYCIDLLLHATDFAVMDISRIRAGSTWEIVRLVRRNSLDNCVFIAHEAYRSEALEGMERLLSPGFVPKLHLFHESGEFVNPMAFNAAVELMLAKSLGKAVS